MKIGIVGYSSHNIDEQLGFALLDKMISRIVANHSGRDPIEIVTGLTNIGIPKLAYQIADLNHYQKIGISAQQAYEVSCGVYPVDKEIIVGEKFGDESQVFVAYIDYLIRVGGGKQSASEVRLFKEKCKALHWDVDNRLAEQAFSLE